MNAHYNGTITEPVPADLFEQRLFAVAKRWHGRSVEEVSAMCNRMQATPDQRANAVRAYMAERQRREFGLPIPMPADGPMLTGSVYYEIPMFPEPDEETA